MCSLQSTTASQTLMPNADLKVCSHASDASIRSKDYLAGCSLGAAQVENSLQGVQDGSD